MVYVGGVVLVFFPSLFRFLQKTLKFQICRHRQPSYI